MFFPKQMPPRRAHQEPLIGSGGIVVGADAVRDARPQGFYARITAQPDTAVAAYGFARVDDSGFAALTGDAATFGDGTSLAAYEVTGRTDVPADGTAVVWCEPLRNAVGYGFRYAITAGGGGVTGSGTVSRIPRWTSAGSPGALGDSLAVLGADGGILTPGQIRAGAALTTLGTGDYLGFSAGFAYSSLTTTSLSITTPTRSLQLNVSTGTAIAQLVLTGHTEFRLVGGVFGCGTSSGVTGTLGPGAAATGGIVTDLGTGSFGDATQAGNNNFSGENTVTGSVLFDGDALQIKDTNGSHALTITPGSDLTAGRTFTLATGDANRTLDISAGSVTVTTAGNALTSAASAGAQRTVLGLGTADAPTFAGGTFTGALTVTTGGATITAGGLTVNAGGANVTGTVTATTFSGSGASLTSLNASNLSSGTVATARLGTGTADGTTFLRGDGTWATPAGGGVSDGDKGDITVSGSGTVWTIDNDAVTYAKLQNVSATQRLLGRNTAGAGDAEEVTLSQALDWANGTAADGNILTRSGGAWVQQPGGAYSVLKDVDAWNERWFANTNASGSDPFIGAAISSGTNTTAPSGTALDGTRYGGVLLRQSATGNSGYLYQTVATAVRFGTENRLFRAHIFHATSLANRTIRVGFHDSTTSADAVDGVYFEIVAGVATGKTSANSVRSTTGTTHTATVNVWYVYEIEVNAAGTLATFRVLDTNESQLFSATLTTNIPTASGRESAVGIVATANTGGAADICVIGFMGFGTRAGYNRMRTAYAAPASGTVMRGHIDGLTLSYNSASVVSFAAGQCTDDTGTFALTLAAFTKTLQSSGSWTAGTGNNGLDTGAIANNTWYHCFVIAKADGTSPDILFSTSATAPTMPSTYTLKRRIGAFKTGVSGIANNWVQRGDEFTWNTYQNDISATNPGTSAVTRALSTPPGVRTRARGVVGFNATATADNPAGIYLSDLNSSDDAPSATINTAINYSTTAHVANFRVPFEVWTDTSSSIRSRCQLSTAGMTLVISTRGWVDPRGRDNL